MNFLNRKMFQAGGSVTYSDGRTQTFDVNEFAQKIQGLPDNEIFALKNSADGGQIVFSPELKAILDNAAQAKQIDVLTFTNLGRPVGSGSFRDLPNIAKGIYGPIARAAQDLILPDELVEQLPRAKALSEYDSPFFGERGAFRRATERGGRTQEELEAIIRDDDIQDFSTQIEEIETPEPTIAGVDEGFNPFEDPIKIQGDGLQKEREDLEKRFEEENITRPEIPEIQPPSILDIEPISGLDVLDIPITTPGLDEIDITLKDILPAEVKVNTEKTLSDSKLDVENKFAGDDLKPILSKVDTTVEDEETRNTARIPVVPKETTGLFGSDRFLDFIRNVGGQLVATGQMGEGLATGAAKAAEERTARELLKEQEEKKYQRDLNMAIAVQRVKNQGSNTGLKPSELGALQTDVTEISTTVKDYEGTEASIDIMNSAIDLFDKAIEDGVPITGLPGYAVRGVDKLKAFMGATDTNVSDSTKIQNYIDQVKQRSIREILNESGRTISNLDREIVDKVFGELDLTGDPKEIRKKLANARANLIRNNEDKKRIIEGKYTIIQNPAYQGVGIQAVSPYLESILRIISGQPVEGITGTGSGVIGSSSVIDIDL